MFENDRAINSFSRSLYRSSINPKYFFEIETGQGIKLYIAKPKFINNEMDFCDFNMWDNCFTG